MDILYEDKEFLVINKPSKFLTIATEKEKNHTLYHEASEYVKKQNPKNKIFILHRLDKDTSGIIVFAKNEKIKQAMQQNWENLVTKREYIAIIEGKLEKKKDTIINYLNSTKTLHVYDTKNQFIGKKSITHYEVLEKNSIGTMITINIDTGRKNQIRVALSSINHPIIGDKKYGSQKNNYGRLALHATKLSWIHPTTKKTYQFIAKIPKEWKKDFKKGIETYEKETND